MKRLLRNAETLAPEVPGKFPQHRYGSGAYLSADLGFQSIPSRVRLDVGQELRSLPRQLEPIPLSRIRLGPRLHFLTWRDETTINKKLQVLPDSCEGVLRVIAAVFSGYGKKLLSRCRFYIEQQLPDEVHVSDHQTPLSGLCSFLPQVFGPGHFHFIPEVQR